MPLTEEQLQRAYAIEREQRESAELFDHYHHYREFWSQFILDKRFVTKEEAQKADRYNGHCVSLGCNRMDCDIE